MWAKPNRLVIRRSIWAPTNFDAVDICRIKLPKKATRTIIYPVLNFFTNYQLENSSGVFQPLAFFIFNATISIESSALLDPSIIDPSTALPAAGKFENVFAYNFRDDRSMQVGDRQRRREVLVRVGNGGINKKFFVDQGVPQATVDAMFVGPMTLRMIAQREVCHGRAYYRKHAPLRRLVAAPRIPKLFRRPAIKTGGGFFLKR